MNVILIVAVIPKYLNFATFSKDLFVIFKLVIINLWLALHSGDETWIYAKFSLVDF
jgi:hypothetical protein